MGEKLVRAAVNFFVRSVIGIALIFFVNEFLSLQGISVSVGMNPGTVFDIGNPWGSGGCAFVWDWVLRNPVRLAQNFSFSKSGIDKRISRGYNRPTS